MATGHSRPDPAKSRIARTMGKARIFSEAMPFIKAYRGTTVVIKYGGSAMVDDLLRKLVRRRRGNAPLRRDQTGHCSRRRAAHLASDGRARTGAELGRRPTASPTSPR